MSYINNIDEIALKIKEADAILVGASNGFSISEGLHIFAGNAAFVETFGDFKRKYGIQNILQGIFFDWPSSEERWAFYARLAARYSLDYTGSPVMSALKTILGDKPYFIVTSNGENHFELAGLGAENILEIEGSWKEMVCSAGCAPTVYTTWESLREMAANEQNGRVPGHLIPRCSKCGSEMMLNFRPDPKHIEAYQTFVETYADKKLLILELGIGWRNQMIKAPLMRLAAQTLQSVYITVNKGEIYIPDNIRAKSYGLDGDMTEILTQLAGAL